MGQKRRMPPEPGPFVLRPLLQNVPLSADGADKDISITCVDYWNGNLYVGTSASELLHFVQMPSDDPTDAGPPFMLASRLQPAFSEPAGPRTGVQQVLLLPRVSKACVLCNSTVTFYSLPELSPVFGTAQVRNCAWIGGVDLNDQEGQDGTSPGVTILLSLVKRIQVVRIGEDARVIKKIDFAGSTLSVRRDKIACVADMRSYALLDVDRQLKIPLTSISSLDASQPPSPPGGQLVAPLGDNGLLRSASSATARQGLVTNGLQSHTRSTSLGNLMSGMRRQERDPDDQVFQDADTSPNRPGFEAPVAVNGNSNKALPAKPSDGGQDTEERGNAPLSSSEPVRLKPHVLSPSPDEFLVVTGTSPTDPAIGMFVNLDGDPSRPTIEFERYPRAIAVDGGATSSSWRRRSATHEDEAYVLASITKEVDELHSHGLEMQRFDVDASHDENDKVWLEIGSHNVPEGSDVPNTPLGIRSLLQGDELPFDEVVEMLSQKRFSPFLTHRDSSTLSLQSIDSRTASSMERQSKERELFEKDGESDDEVLPEGWEAARIKDEQDFVRRLAKTSTMLAVWAGPHIWWAVRNPLLLQLECRLPRLQDQKKPRQMQEERRQLFSILRSIRGRDARTELEFMTFGYIRQRAGVMLLASFLGSEGAPFSQSEMEAMEEVLLEGLLDPRVVLSFVPVLRNEMVEKVRGTWIYGGVKSAVEAYIAADAPGKTVASLGGEVLQFLRRFLLAWRKKKGFGSVPDEKHVFRSVDASLLLVLLELDKDTSEPGSVRAELYDVVDGGLECFDRAVHLLETYGRLFVLSRLYQSRKSAGDVLATWRRIIEGDSDDGDELGDGEQRVRAYLVNVGNQALVQEYGLWLARRNPRLGVQVFADEKGVDKAPRFEHAAVVALLRREAPDAVPYFLEHLVFGRGNTTYVDELVAYYLDVVTHALRTSQPARDAMATSYDVYRALRPPKPTYRQFLAAEAPPEDDEARNGRLRLLQLLAGPHDYDAEAVAKRIAAALPDHDGAQLLVPEAIVLDGRAGRHDRALRLLVHRLGDYDTAVSYCLRGGGRAQHQEQEEDLQIRLFSMLLGEFLALADPQDRMDQTAALLGRFGAWFDVLDVLRRVPDDWAVGVAAGFLETALRRLVKDAREAGVARALSSAENLVVSCEVLARVAEKGPVVQVDGNIGVGAGQDA